MTFNKKEYNNILSNISEFGQNNTKLVAVSKNHPKESVLEAIKCGVSVFGENRVQEAQHKFCDIKKSLKHLDLHLTGPLQTNKVKLALDIFDTFQTLDREKLAKEFYKHKEKLNNKKFFIQINIGKEASKSGVYPEDADNFINYCKHDLSMKIDGLMCIPPIEDAPILYFLRLKEIAKNNNITQLSMGMSEDYLEGIKCGATYIRVGTLLFGQRVYEN